MLETGAEQQASFEAIAGVDRFGRVAGRPLAVERRTRGNAPDVTLIGGLSAVSQGDASLAREAARPNRSVLKRLLDLVGASLGVLVLLPFLCLLALLIRIESPGPALFRQRRTGRGGKVFFIYKFRTMSVLEDGESVVQATSADARITPLGAFLRRSCIDELPQLFNVIRGDMSLVGPRPHAIVHDAYYSKLIPEYQGRMLVRPGIAGLAQVCGYRGATPALEMMAQRVQLDREYISRWSLALDLRILMQALSDGPFHPSAF
jgi:putative colanic acid biosynthesis UDP-glucose lipid carrier transferase